MFKNKIISFFLAFLAIPVITFSQEIKGNDGLYIDDSSLDPIEFSDLSEKYNGEEFIYERTIQNSGWWARFKKWLSDLFRDMFNFSESSESANFVDALINVLVIIIFTLVLFFIFRAIVNREGRWVFGRNSDRKVINAEELEENLGKIDFKKMITDAEGSGNFRMAVRYYYLWVLKKLSDAEIIKFDLEKTNSDYYYEIKDKDLRDDFSYGSYVYNYIWYGENKVGNEQFQQAKSAYNKLLNRIKG